MIRRTIWSISRLSYIYLVKPILFMISPDSVHKGMIRLTSFVGSTGLLRGLLRLLFVRSKDSRLQQTHFGVVFDNPVGLAAGFDKNGQIMPTIAALGFGFGTVGSVTASNCIGNDRPWFYRLPKSQSLVVNAGLANHGSGAIVERIGQINVKRLRRFAIVLSVAKTNSKEVVSDADGIVDYVETVNVASRESNIKLIELNISCPNTYGGEPFTTPDRLEKLLTAVDDAMPLQPVIVKMPNNLPWGEFKMLLDVIVQHKVEGVTVSNLAKDRTKVELKDDLPDSVLGSLSGKPTFAASNDLIRQTYLEYGDKIKIIGVGGVFTADDAYTKIKLGASLVELITGMIFTGPQIAAQINDGLIRLMKRDGYSNIGEAIGVDAAKTN